MASDDVEGLSWRSEAARERGQYSSSTSDDVYLFSVWDIYFHMIVGWQFHPGYLRDGTTSLTLEECAQIADKMMEIRSCRIWQ